MQRSLPVADLEARVLRLNALTTRRDGFSRTAAATLTRLAGSGPTRLTELATAEGVNPAADERLGRAIGAVAVVAAVLVLSTGHRMLAAADAGLDGDGHSASEHGPLDDVAGEVADQFGGASAAIDSELREKAHTRS